MYIISIIRPKNIESRRLCSRRHQLGSRARGGGGGGGGGRGGLVIFKRWQVFDMQMTAGLQSQQNLWQAGVCQTPGNVRKVHNYCVSRSI